MLKVVRDAAKTCQFHHSFEPSVPVGRDKNSTLNEDEMLSESDEFMDVDLKSGVSGSRSLVGDIAAFCVKWKITREASNELLRLLSSHNVKGLPRDCRSAKRSMRVVENVVEMGNGSYYHFGVGNELTRNLSIYKELGNTIDLQFNIDGLPLFRSSPVDFWPILCRAFVGGSVTSVFPVALFCGKSKPASVDDYLKLFLQELNAILQNGIHINDANVKVRVHSFVCDAPARQYVKKVKGHSGYNACERCEIHGERNEGNEPGIKFVDVKNKLRTDELFRSESYGGHQKSDEWFSS